jgi:hypothetical protein
MSKLEGGNAMATYTLVTSAAGIATCQNKFQNYLTQALTLSGRFNLSTGGHGGRPNELVSYAPKQVPQFWYCHNIVDSRGKRRPSRHWNVFGVLPLSPHPTFNIITVEINVRKEGLPEQANGAFARDDNGRYCILHRGVLGGAFRDSRQRFLSWYPYPTGTKLYQVNPTTYQATPLPQQKQNDAVLVAFLDSCDKLVTDIEFFVCQVNQFKTTKD